MPSSNIWGSYFGVDSLISFFSSLSLSYSINLLAFFYIPRCSLQIFFCCSRYSTRWSCIVTLLKEKPVSNAHTNYCLLYRSATKFFFSLTPLYNWRHNTKKLKTQQQHKKKSCEEGNWSYMKGMITITKAYRWQFNRISRVVFHVQQKREKRNLEISILCWILYPVSIVISDMSKRDQHQPHSIYMNL